MKKTIILRIQDGWESYDSLQECPLDLQTFVRNIQDSHTGEFTVAMGDRNIDGSLVELEGDLPKVSFDTLYGLIVDCGKSNTHFYWVEVIDA